MSGEHFLVPKRGVDWEEVELAMERLGARVVEPDDDDILAWTLNGCELHYYEDAALHVEQLSIEGPECDDVVDRVRDTLPTYSVEDLPGLFADAQSEDDLDDALAILALVAPAEADPALVRLFRRGLHHEDWLIRQAALIAASVPAWPQLSEDVRRLARDDENDEVRGVARRVLSTITANGDK